MGVGSRALNKKTRNIVVRECFTAGRSTNCRMSATTHIGVMAALAVTIRSVQRESYLCAKQSTPDSTTARRCSLAAGSMGIVGPPAVWRRISDVKRQE